MKAFGYAHRSTSNVARSNVSVITLLASHRPYLRDSPFNRARGKLENFPRIVVARVTRVSASYLSSSSSSCQFPPKKRTAAIVAQHRVVASFFSNSSRETIYARKCSMRRRSARHIAGNRIMLDVNGRWHAS